MMRIIRTPIATSAPYVLAEAKALLRVDGDVSDAEIARMGDAAARELEHHASLALLRQSIRLELDSWPGGDVLPLPVGPVLAGAPVTVTDGGEPFTGCTLSHGLRPALRINGAAPGGAVVVTYEAGFGTEPATIPDDLRLAVLNQAGAYFDLRGASDGKLQALSPHAARIAARYRRVAI